MAKEKVNAKATKKAAVEPDSIVKKVEAALNLVRVHQECIREQQKNIAEAAVALFKAKQAFNKLTKEVVKLGKKLK